MKRAGARAMHVPTFAQTASDRYTMNGVKTMFKKLLALLLLAGFVAGCNTMAGAGKDIQRGGEKLQDSAEKNKK
jgi:entericidin B